MIEWIDKIPDSLSGVLAASAVWIGFNYIVLAPRAMEKLHSEVTIPRCAEDLQSRQQALRMPMVGLGEMLGLPQLGPLERRFAELARPRLLSRSELVSRCACAASRASASARFDYTIHTTSFRIIAPQSVAGLGDLALGSLVEGACGAMPQALWGR